MSVQLQPLRGEKPSIFSVDAEKFFVKHIRFRHPHLGPDQVGEITLGVVNGQEENYRERETEQGLGFDAAMEQGKQEDPGRDMIPFKSSQRKVPQPKEDDEEKKDKFFVQGLQGVRFNKLSG